MKQIRNFEELVARASEKKGVGIAVVAPYDKNTVLAVQDALVSGLAVPQLFGDKERISAVMEENQVDPASFSIIDVKPMSEIIQAAIDSIKEGKNHILMKGTLATGALLKPALDKVKGLNAGRLVSHMVVLDIPGFDRLLISTDGGLNIAPTMMEKADIIKNAVDVAHALDIQQPRVALLAAVETVNPKMQATIDAACLSKMGDRGAFKNAVVEGPLAIDNILSAESAKKKGIKSDVCGNADIIVAPSIEVANTFSKTLNYLLHSSNAGIVVGTKAPIILPSRASDSKSKYASLALGVLLAK